MLLTQSYDLTPYYVAHESFEAGYRAYKRGRLDQAERKLRAFLDGDAPGDVEQSGRYLLCVILDERARGANRRSQKEALQKERVGILHELADYEPLTGAIHSELGDYYADAGDPVSALHHYGKVPRGGTWFLRTRIAAAKLALARGRSALALEYIDAALEAGASQRERAKLVLMKARALADSNETAEAIALLRTLWIERYGRRSGASAERALTELGHRPTHAEKVVLEFARVRSGKRGALLKKHRSIGRKLKGAGKHAMDFARGILEGVRKKGRKVSLKYLRRAADARNGFVRGYALYHLGRALSRMGRRPDAIDHYVQLQRELPQHPMAAAGLIRAAKLARKEGEDGRARALMERLVTIYPHHPKRVEYFWSLAWETRREGKVESARDMFDKIAREEGSGRHLGQATWAERAAYWRGRCELELGQKNQAVRTWSWLVRRFPLTYYSHQAFNRLRDIEPETARRLRPLRELQPWDQAALTDLSSLVIQEKPELDAAVTLSRLGLYKAARKDLSIRARTGDLGTDGMTLLLSLGLREKRYRESHALIRWRGTLPRYPDEAYERLWKLAYPLPFIDTVEKYAEKRAISPWLVLALIRHESAYDPRAVSRSNAIGLMQMLPATAGAVARKLLGRRRPTIRKLKQPRVNIRHGTRLLQELLGHFQNNEALVLSAYNAGTARARRWYGEHLRSGRTSTDEFIEEIGPNQTHSYVKSILATWGVYRYLYGSRQDTSNRTIPLEADLPPELGTYFGKRIRVR